MESSHINVEVKLHLRNIRCIKITFNASQTSIDETTLQTT